MKYILAFLLLVILSVPALGQSDDYALGDINTNTIPYEIADVVLLSNYFIYGDAVFASNIEKQKLASDVNQDGYYPEVSDLQFMTRVVIGDANPNNPPQETLRASVTVDGNIYSTDDDISAILVVVEGNQTPELLDGSKELRYNFDGIDTKILIYSLDNIGPLSGDFLIVSGELKLMQASSSKGNRLDINTSLPLLVYLDQNYPNPFYPVTWFSLTSGIETKVDMAVYNLLGQRVFSWKGHVNPGVTEIEWNAENLAPGIYFYKILNHPGKIKKLVLLR